MKPKSISLVEFAESFDTTIEELKVIMLADKDFFNEWSIKGADNLIYLSQKALDRLEELFNNKEQLKINVDDIVKSLGSNYETVNNIIKNNKNKFNNRILVKKQGRIELATIKYEGALFLYTEILNTSDEAVMPKSIDELPVSEETKEKVRKKEVSVGYKTDDNSLTGHTYIFDDDGNTLNDFKKEKEEDMKEEDKKINQSAKKPVEKTVEKAAEPQTEETSAKPKPARKKKTKYLAGASYIKKLNESVYDIKAIRSFLLSLNQYKVDEIAIMSDDEIKKLISDEYVILDTSDDVLIINKEALLSISDKIFAIPKQKEVL